MVRASSISTDDAHKTAKVFLEADTKAQVESATPETIEGFPEGYAIDFFSKAMTTSGDFGIYQSDGTWNWGE